MTVAQLQRIHAILFDSSLDILPNKFIYSQTRWTPIGTKQKFSQNSG